MFSRPISLTVKVCALLAVVAVVAIALTAPGTGSAAVGPESIPFFSVDSVSPSGTSAANIYETHNRTAAKPASFSIELAAAALGLAAGDDVDAVSGGNDWVDPIEPCAAIPKTAGPKPNTWATPIYFWSVQRFATGSNGGLTLATQAPFSCVAAGNPIAREIAAGDGMAADVYFQVSMVAASKAGAFTRANVKWRDETDLGLISFVDDLDALQATTGSIGTPDFDFAAEDGVPDVDVFFSVDPATAAALGGGITEADILLMPAGGGAPVVYASSAALGLVAGDDIDALCLEDTDTNFASGARALISLAPGSPSLALAPGYTAGDAFKVGPADPFPGSGLQVPFLPYSFLSLAAGDDLDALFCGIGDPPHEGSGIGDPPGPVPTKEPPPHGIYEILITASPAQVDNGIVTSPGTYFHCLADNQPSGKDMSVRLYCYDDNPSLAVNAQDSPGVTGDGLPGTGPPWRAMPAIGPPEIDCARDNPADQDGDTVANDGCPTVGYGDVDSKHTELNGVYDNGDGSTHLAGCFADEDASSSLGITYWELIMFTKEGGFASGTVDIWAQQDWATCAAGAAPGTYVGSPTANPAFNDASFFWQRQAADKGHDSDGDGLPDAVELRDDGTTACGLRDPFNPYDWYDVNQDGVIDLLNDILGVISHYQPAPGGAPPYDANWDRPPSMTGGIGHWNRGAPDGVIDLLNDILGVISQYHPGPC